MRELTHPTATPPLRLLERPPARTARPPRPAAQRPLPWYGRLARLARWWRRAS